MANKKRSVRFEPFERDAKEPCMAYAFNGAERVGWIEQMCEFKEVGITTAVYQKTVVGYDATSAPGPGCHGLESREFKTLKAARDFIRKGFEAAALK